MKTKMALNEAVQVGPWRVARKHLLFVIIFGLVIIAFGFIILQTHVFDNEEEAEDDDEGDEEGDEEWPEFGERFSGGDWVMVAIMVAAGLLSLIAVFVCVLVKKNAPRRLSTSQRNASIYSVQFNSNETKAPVPVQSPGAPQQLPVWAGQLVQQQRQQQQQEPQKHQKQQPILTLPQVLTAPQIHRAARSNAAVQQSSVDQQPQIRVGMSHAGGASAPEASAPQYEGERPPPYSP